MKIIADVCCNHLGNKQVLDEMIRIADETDIDILKFQLFTANKLDELWSDQYIYYKNHEINKDMFTDIVLQCKERKIMPLFTLFDPEKESWLHDAGLKAVKVGSAEAHHAEWVMELSDNFDTVFVSCGMIDDNLIRNYRRVPNIKLLYCISKYPLRSHEIDFKAMKNFNGFSDHTQDITASKRAIDLNMEYVERHYTLCKQFSGKDHKISSTPEEFLELVNHKKYVEGKTKFQGRWRF